MGISVGKDLPQSILVTWTVSELNDNIIGLVTLIVGDNFETNEIVSTPSTRADEIIQAIFVDNAKICHVGILLADAETCRSGEPLVDRVHGIVLPPEHQIRLINMMPDAELPSILADALSDADALLLTKIVNVHRPTIRAGDGGPPYLTSSHSTTTTGIATLPVDLVTAVLFRLTERKDCGGRANIVLAEGILEEIFLPLGNGFVAGRLGDGFWQRPDGAVNFVIINDFSDGIGSTSSPGTMLADSDRQEAGG